MLKNRTERSCYILRSGFSFGSKKKPFSDAEEITKPVFEIAARMFGDKKAKTKFDQIPLYSNTLTWRFEELANDVYRQVAAHVTN